jgi:carbonic anhydrase
MTKISSSPEHKRASHRREFLKTVALGGGAGLLSMAFGSRAALGAGEADALLLSCIDYRLIDYTLHYMVGRGLRDKYDQVILAGASLGAITDKFPEWNKTFWDHLGLAIKLHGIHRVIVLDHRKCGAYDLILGEACCKNRDDETKAHRTQLKSLYKAIKKKYPELEVELLLMDLDGTVEKM